MWQLLETGHKTAKENMELDAALLQKLDPQGAPILHLYRFEAPSATYGYFIKTEKFLNLQATQKRGIHLARRPTGGGIIFHVSDLAFSVLIPAEHEGFSKNTLENYHYINRKVVAAIEGLREEASLELLPANPVGSDASCEHFCMAKPTIFDVMMEGKKIAGAAQRKQKQGFLHQGSISIAMPQEAFLREVLLPETEVLEAMKAHTHTLLQEGWTQQDLEEMREMLEKHLKRVFLEG